MTSIHRRYQDLVTGLTPTEQAPTKGDVILAGALLCVAVLSGWFFDAQRPDTVGPETWWQWLLLVTPALLVGLRRLNPPTVVVAATVAQAAIWISGLPDVLLALLVIYFTATSEGGKRGFDVTLVSTIALTALTAVGVRLAGDVTLYQVPLVALTCGTAMALGITTARQRRAVADLASEVTEARVRSTYERAEAISTERSHIARELHDIIGHTLSVIAVRAEAADRVGHRQPQAAGDAVVAIAAAARSALTETRQVLAGLRSDDDSNLHPPPDLASIRNLVEELSTAGVDASYAEEGCDRWPPPAVVVGGAHRIVQESLTNALRHAGPETRISVNLVCKAGALDVTISDDGPGRTQPGPTPDTSVLEGSGLAGMAERAEVLGGRFEAGRSHDGGFVVNAVLPVGNESKL